MLHVHILVSFFLLSNSLPVRSLVGEEAGGSATACNQQICFHQPQELCPEPGDRCRCSLVPGCGRSAVCCDVDKTTLYDGVKGCPKVFGDPSIEALHIRNASLDVLNLSHRAWKPLRFMSVTDGRIGSVVGEFARHTKISCLNLSSNGIHKLEQRSLVNLFNLNYLDLSRNNLTDIPRFKKEGTVNLDISNNPPLLCSSLRECIGRPEVYFHNENSTICSSSATFHWFNSTEHLAISDVRLLLELEKDCIPNCTCKPYRLDIEIGKSPKITIVVNCSSLQLTALPTPLPPYTIYLDVSNNSITSLKELSDHSYQHLRFLYADKNQISSIQPLEGTKFMNRFTTFSLQNNRIRTFETYLLSNIKFYRTSNMRQMYLGYNNLHCDCKTAMEFKVWLLTKVNSIPDYQHIKCENLPLRVIELDQTKLCQGQQDWTDYIYYIITAEVLLLIGLIAKVSYDYWKFKTAGYLPWPASKMPRLPCDWLCE